MKMKIYNLEDVIYYIYSRIDYHKEQRESAEELGCDMAYRIHDESIFELKIILNKLNEMEKENEQVQLSI